MLDNYESDNMVKKAWVDDSGCDICPASESINHIVLRCQNADKVWERLHLAAVATRCSTLAEFMNLSMTDTMPSGWAECFAACAWTLWTARNDRVFNNRATARSRLFSRIREELGLWATRDSEKASAIGFWAQKFQV